MSKMITLDPFHTNWLKCKRCKNVFRVLTENKYVHTVCYCPFCGQDRDLKREPKKKQNKQTMDEWWTENNDPHNILKASVKFFIENRKAERKNRI